MSSLLKIMPIFKATVHQVLFNLVLKWNGSRPQIQLPQLLRCAQTIYLFYFLSITNLAFLLSHPHPWLAGEIIKLNVSSVVHDLKNPLDSVSDRCLVAAPHPKIYLDVWKERNMLCICGTTWKHPRCQVPLDLWVHWLTTALLKDSGPCSLRQSAVRAAICC